MRTFLHIKGFHYRHGKAAPIWFSVGVSLRTPLGKFTAIPKPYIVNWGRKYTPNCLFHSTPAASRPSDLLNIEDGSPQLVGNDEQSNELTIGGMNMERWIVNDSRAYMHACTWCIVYWHYAGSLYDHRQQRTNNFHRSNFSERTYVRSPIRHYFRSLFSSRCQSDLARLCPCAQLRNAAKG